MCHLGYTLQSMLLVTHLSSNIWFSLSLCVYVGILDFFIYFFFHCVVYKVNASEEKHTQNHTPQWVNFQCDNRNFHGAQHTHTHFFLSSSNSVKSIQVESKFICVLACACVAQNRYTFIWLSFGWYVQMYVCVHVWNEIFVQCITKKKLFRLQYTSDHCWCCCCWFGSWEYFIHLFCVVYPCIRMYVLFTNFYFISPRIFIFMESFNVNFYSQYFLQISVLR